MIFVSAPTDLEYYNPNADWGCYADMIMQPNDVLLQVMGLPVSGFGAPIFNLTISTYKPDGVTLLSADDTAYFDYYFAKATINGVDYYYCNIRLNNYSPTMLANGCFVLYVKITNVGYPNAFKGYTQKYEIKNTAVIPSGVTITVGSGNNNQSIATPCGTSQAPDNCNFPYVQLTCEFDCLDTFTGDYYGDPTVILSSEGNTDFNFIRLSNIKGRFRKLPREIKTTVSINCRVQRTETTPKYTLDGIQPFPVWKMEEIENMLLSNHIFVDGVEYQLSSGSIFAQLGQPKNCVYVYKMNIPFIGCYEWQVYGCTPVCAAQTYYYAIPV